MVVNHLFQIGYCKMQRIILKIFFDCRTRVISLKYLFEKVNKCQRKQKIQQRKEKQRIMIHLQRATWPTCCSICCTVRKSHFLKSVTKTATGRKTPPHETPTRYDKRRRNVSTHRSMTVQTQKCNQQNEIERQCRRTHYARLQFSMPKNECL